MEGNIASGKTRLLEYFKKFTGIVQVSEQVHFDAIKFFRFIFISFQSDQLPKCAQWDRLTCTCPVRILGHV